MSEQMRYRVTGAIFLFALLVILAPMLFDADGIPKVAVESLPPASPREPVRAPEGAFTAEAFDEVVAQSQDLRDEVDREGFRSDDGTRHGEVSLRQPDAETDTWAVQVASFKDSANAQQLRDKLRQANFESFLTSRKQGRDVWTRVAVGPYLKQAEAERVLAKISKEFSVEAQLMEFSR